MQPFSINYQIIDQNLFQIIQEHLRLQNGNVNTKIGW